jgi:PEP-CTERM motif
MSAKLRIVRTFGLAAALLFVAGAQRATAAAYTARLINIAGYNFGEAEGISGASVVVTGHPSATGGYYDALLWNNTANSLMSLNPGPEWSTKAYGVSSDSQVGTGQSTTTGGDHAFLWHGTAASFVDLNPAGFGTSTAYAVSGNNQVGIGGLITQPQGGDGHALLWHGSAGSAVDLNPIGFAGSGATGVFGDDIVGSGHFGNAFSGDYRALLWRGPTHTVVDLKPAGFAASSANGVSQDSQVGIGNVTSVFSGATHALLWHGTAASVIDLHPAVGFVNTSADRVAGNLQVGFGDGAATGGQDHALLWSGTAVSVVDLHSLLVGLGPDFVTSYASDIDPSGTIVGFAYDANFVAYPVIWSPVPEPGSFMLAALAVVGLAAWLGRRRARWGDLIPQAEPQRCQMELITREGNSMRD